jgi:membrane protein implicated in regulation of membrane protease activity
MCHVLLLMPLLTLPVFWLLPVYEASVVYGAILFISVLLYWKIYRAMTRKVITGKEALVGAAGRVLEADRPLRPRVIVRSEIWNAESSHPLSAGEPVVILSVRGLRLTVDSPELAPASLRAGGSRRSCHG